MEITNHLKILFGSMKKITEDAYNAFIKRKRFKCRNTEVKIDDSGDFIFLYLFGNCIARTCEGITYISDGGYGYSGTTAERLSPFKIKLRGVKGEWILNEKQVWDGKWLQIN